MKMLWTILVCTLWSTMGLASDLTLGLQVAPAFVRNADFNGEHVKTTAHLNLGLNLSYPLNCSSRFCTGLFLEPGFSFTLPATTSFGSTQVASSGLSGNYSESQKIYSGDLNLKKHFKLSSKLTAFAASGVGLSYFQLSNISFTDALGQPQALNVSTSSLNFNVNLGAGLAYEVNSKLLIDVGIVPHLVFAHVSDQSYLTVPIGLHYAL